MKKRILVLTSVAFLLLGMSVNAYASWYCCGEGPCTWVEDGSEDIIE